MYLSKGTDSTYRLGEHPCAGFPHTASVCLRVPHPLWAFVPSYFPANHCCFACVTFHIPILPFPPALPSFPRSSLFIPHFPSQNPVEHVRSRFLLQRTSFYIPLPLPAHVLPFPLVFPYPVLPFVPVLSMFVSHFPSQIPIEHARSRSLLQHASFPFPLPFPPVLPCSVDFTITYWFYLYCDHGDVKSSEEEVRQ